jgi:hypothetical protein
VGYMTVNYIVLCIPCLLLSVHKEPGSSVSIVYGYGLDDRAIGVRYPAGAKDFSLTSVSKPALGPTQRPVQWVPGSFPRDKARLGHDADYSPPYNAEVKNE